MGRLWNFTSVSTAPLLWGHRPLSSFSFCRRKINVLTRTCTAAVVATPCKRSLTLLHTQDTLLLLCPSCKPACSWNTSHYCSSSSSGSGSSSSCGGSRRSCSVNTEGRFYNSTCGGSTIPCNRIIINSSRGFSSTKPSMSAPGPTRFPDQSAIDFLQQTVNLIVKKVFTEGMDTSKPVIDFKHPLELKSVLNLEVSKEPTPHAQLLEDMEQVLHYSVKTGHPHFYNQLFAGVDPYSQAGAWMTEATNSNIHTYEACPVHVLMEQYLVEKICGIIGFSNGDGLFLPGGSTSNTFALHLARFHKCPEIKQKGMFEMPRLRMYMGEDGHYSGKKAASYLGLGIDNVVPVKTDEMGRIIVSDLEAKVKEDQDKGYCPFFVMATSGTTVLGAFDRLADISAVCKKHGLWLHDDACWGAPAILSPKYKHLVEGSELCDSFAWNFHKLNGIPVQCSALLVNHKGLMEEANNFKAEYLFQPDKFYDTSYDIGDKTIMCGRKADGLKLWVQWKALGDEGMAARIEQSFDNARYLAETMKNTDGFRLVVDEISCTNVCFWYIPPRLRNQPESKEWWDQIKVVAPKIKEGMMKAGSMMIGFQPLSSRGLVNFFRIVINNPNNTHRDMDFVIQEIDRLGRDL